MSDSTFRDCIDCVTLVFTDRLSLPQIRGDPRSSRRRGRWPWTAFRSLCWSQSDPPCPVHELVDHLVHRAQGTSRGLEPALVAREVRHLLVERDARDAVALVAK